MTGHGMYSFWPMKWRPHFKWAGSVLWSGGRSYMGQKLWYVTSHPLTVNAIPFQQPLTKEWTRSETAEKKPLQLKCSYAKRNSCTPPPPCTTNRTAHVQPSPTLQLSIRQEDRLNNFILLFLLLRQNDCVWVSNAHCGEIKWECFSGLQVIANKKKKKSKTFRENSRLLPNFHCLHIGACRGLSTLHCSMW